MKVAKAKLPCTSPATANVSQHIRHGFGAIRPYLQGYPDTWTLVRDALGAVEIEREEFGPYRFHLEAIVGDSVVVLEISDPPHPQSFPGSVYVYVEDADKACRRALEVGALLVQEPTDKSYGERQACVTDSFGNVYWIATLQNRAV